MFKSNDSALNFAITLSYRLRCTQYVWQHRRDNTYHVSNLLPPDTDRWTVVWLVNPYGH